jgi:hypothetical protein
MPIFHDPHDSPPRRPSSRQTSSGGQRGAESPIAGSDASLLDNMRPWDSDGRGAAMNMNSDQRGSGRKQASFDRMELIERLKRTKSPPWQRDQDVSRPQPMRREHAFAGYCGVSTNASPQNERSHDRSTEPQPNPRDRPTSPSVPFTELRTPRTPTPDPLRDLAAAGLEIERPRSALHSGDFRARKDDGGQESVSSAALYLATSPVVPWSRSFPAANRMVLRILSMRFSVRSPAPSREQERHHSHRQARSRFYLRPAHWCSKPTTPISTSPRDRSLDKDQKVQMATTGDILSRQLLSRHIRVHPCPDPYPALQLLGISVMGAPHLTKRINQDALSRSTSHTLTPRHKHHS